MPALLLRVRLYTGPSEDPVCRLRPAEAGGSRCLALGTPGDSASRRVRVRADRIRPDRDEALPAHRAPYTVSTAAPTHVAGYGIKRSCPLGRDRCRRHASKRFNDTNELKGVKINFTEFADDGADPATTLSIERRLVTQTGVFAIVPEHVGHQQRPTTSPSSTCRRSVAASTRHVLQPRRRPHRSGSSPPADASPRAIPSFITNLFQHGVRLRGEEHRQEAPDVGVDRQRQPRRARTRSRASSRRLGQGSRLQRRRVPRAPGSRRATTRPTYSTS